MRLQLPELPGERRVAFEADVDDLIDCTRLRPPVCRMGCVEAASRACSSCCPHASRALTSDADFPIEPGILPLVFEFRASRLYDPVWSCEGHCDHTGTVFRRPSVWFCCESATHTRVLAEVVAQLELERVVDSTWKVLICTPGQATLNAIYALEPESASRASLKALHRDAGAMAGQLRNRLAARAGILRRHVAGDT